MRIEEYVQCLGLLTGEAKRQAVQNCDVFVLPSYSESFGLAAVEAMANGKPVIVSDRVAIHDVIAESQAGLVTPCQVEALVDAILRLAGDAHERQQMGQRGHALALDKFALRRTTCRLLEKYQECLKL